MCIVSVFMDNIKSDVVEAQAAVVAKFNRNKYQHIQLKTPASHGKTMDWFWQENKSLGFKNVMFLDIDAIPLTHHTLQDFHILAKSDRLVGNAQVSNHLPAYKDHVYVAPSAMALSEKTFWRMGQPSALPLIGDCAQSYTWAAEKVGIKVHHFMPTSFMSNPYVLLDPETIGTCEPWPLGKTPHWYGQGTIFGSNVVKKHTYHQFQIRIPEAQDSFILKCEEVLSAQDTAP